MIEISNLTENLIDEDFLKKVAEEVLKGEKKENENLSIALVGPGRMKALNKRYLEKNRVTDVLAFGGNSQFPIPNSKFGLGEIVICLREIKKNAKKFRQSFEKELAICLIHGILHLLGYNHEKNEKAAKEMEENQQHYFLKIFM